jgi:hypothetical protein
MLRDRLVKMGACEDAVAWVGDRDITAAWAECDRADWMLWLAGRVVARPLVVLAACACARTALRYVLAGEDRPRVAIETAERWARGEATIAEVRSAAAYVAYAANAYAAYAAAAAAAYAAAYAAAAAYVAYAAAAAYADAAYAAAYASAAATSRKVALAQMADLVRGIIVADQVAAGLEGRND